MDSYSGFEFLGYCFRVINNKIVINVKKSNYNRRKYNMKYIRYLYDKGYISYKRYFNSMNNYINCYKYIDR